jgi:pyruvate, water dikinase
MDLNRTPREPGDAPVVDWRVLVSDLGRSDPRLLEWVTRKVLNHVRWKGVAEAEAMVQSLDPDDESHANGESNRPLARVGSTALSAEAVFELAVQHLGEAEVLALMAMWRAQDRVRFLIRLLEDQGSPLGEIAEALERFHHLAIEEAELPHSVQIMLRVALLRRFFTDQIDYINSARSVTTIRDFHELSRSLVAPPRSHGRLGGKSAGLFLARRIVESSPLSSGILANVRVPPTWYVASDAVLAFVRHNNLEDIYDQKYLDTDQIQQQYPHVIQVFKSAEFPAELRKGMAAALDDLGDGPLIVRSSSLLEDRTGSVFSGKYKSLFLANQGSRQRRLRALQDAIAEVYASIFGPDPLEYRADRNLLDVHEEMGIMIQRVVGRRVGRYFLPSWSGVALSHNEFRWSPRIRREDGLVRLVAGLGTRAVDRLTDDYSVLFAPRQPGLRVNTTPEATLRYAPRRMDVIDLGANEFTTVPIADVLRRYGNELPDVRRIVSIHDDGRLRRPGGVSIDFGQEEAVVTFEGLATETPFLERIATLLDLLGSRLAMPVDLEFASDGEQLYLLQCRPQSFHGATAPAPIPRDVPRDRILFTADRHVSNGWARGLTHVVYVDPAAYSRLADRSALLDVGRAVGRLNRVLPRRRFILVGPGRWGSRGDIRLGVSVTYSDISNTAILVELARRQGSYVPDLSFGTHFFQDLVEAEIRYLPLYPDDEGNVFEEEFLLGASNRLAELVPEHAELAEVIHVIDIAAETGGDSLTVCMNGERNEAIAYLEPAPRERASCASDAG